jgi:serine/threonine-protein phosphatase CPPED1
MKAVRAFALIWALLLAGAQPAIADAFEPFEFALLGDPQIGFGPGAEYADASRLSQVVDHIAASGLPLSIVAGDLVQDRSLWQHWAYGRVARGLPGKVLLVPGNHDVIDSSSLRDWRERHGLDYHDAVWRNVAFVMLNSETLRDQRISPLENAAQWEFLQRSLATHRTAGRTHIVLVMHRPPFVSSENEGEQEANWPPESRARLLALARAHGVRWILAGHLHRTALIEASDGLRILVGAGSALSFDRSPVAYHRLRVERTSIDFEQVVVAPPPAEPFAVRGLSGWTPRLFDPSLRHWIFTLAYATVGALAWRTSRRTNGIAQRLWRTIGLLLFALGANTQLDIDELVSEVGRIAAKLLGIYALRHVITGFTVLAVAGGAVLLFARSWSRTRRERAALTALALLAPSLAWFCLSAISHHGWGMLFNEGWWDLLILAALIGITACSVRQVTPARKRT